MDNGEAELIRPEDVQVLTTMDRVVSGSRRAIAEARAAGNEMTIAFAQAAGITQLQKAMTKEFMAVIMPLQGTSLGFVTDRDAAGGYPAETVRDCMISALMCGVGVAGNQFNIISGKMYITLAGVSRIVYGWPGICFKEDPPGVPRVEEAGSGALVEMSATWTLNGKHDEMRCVKGANGQVDTRICVRVNKGMGTDAILGKARRKFLARVWTRLLGTGGNSPAPVAEIGDLNGRSPDPEFDEFLADAPSAFDAAQTI